MYIISKFKDYYDYISNVYGPDKSVVYNRNNVDPTLCKNKKVWENIKQLPSLYTWPTRFEKSWSIKWVCICGSYYLIAGRIIRDTMGFQYGEPKYNVLNEKEHGELYHHFLRERWHSKPKYSDFVGCHDKNLVQLSKELKQPIFMIDETPHKTSIILNPKVPRLADYSWFTKNYPTEQMWQNISQFISNTIRENPDIKVPVELADKYKIEKHGFDLKKSFRKRKDE